MKSILCTEEEAQNALSIMLDICRHNFRVGCPAYPIEIKLNAQTTALIREWYMDFAFGKKADGIVPEEGE